MNMSRVEHGLPARRRNTVTHAAGNTMTISTIGSVLQFMYLFMEFAQSQDATGSESSTTALSKWRQTRGIHSRVFTSCPQVSSKFSNSCLPSPQRDCAHTSVASPELGVLTNSQPPQVVSAAALPIVPA